MDYLLDKHQIEQVYIRYCEIVDSKLFDAMDEVFLAECQGDYTQALGPDVISPNRESLIASMYANLGAGSNCGATQHNVNNFRISIAGDTAKAKVNYYAVHRGLRDFEGELYSMWGQYEDDLRRTANGWRVSHRVYFCFLSEGPAGVTSATNAAES